MRKSIGDNLSSPRRNVGVFYFPLRDWIHCEYCLAKILSQARSGGYCLAKMRNTFAKQYWRIMFLKYPMFPKFPKYVPEVPDVPDVPAKLNVVWQNTYYKLPNNIGAVATGRSSCRSFNNILTN